MPGVGVTTSDLWYLPVRICYDSLTFHWLVFKHVIWINKLGVVSQHLLLTSLTGIIHIDLPLPLLLQPLERILGNPISHWIAPNRVAALFKYRSGLRGLCGPGFLIKASLFGKSTQLQLHCHAFTC